MTIKVEKDDCVTATTITERFTGPFHGTGITTETTHIKLYPIDSNTFSFSVTCPIETPHPHGRRTVYQVGHVIHEEFLVSNEICSIHLKNLLSILRLRPALQNFIVRYISTEALEWKTNREGEGGYKIEFNVEVNFELNLKVRDGEIGLRELSDGVSRIELGCSGETEMKITCLHNNVSTSKTRREEIQGCILQKDMVTRREQVESRLIESKRFCFSVKYEKTKEVHRGNLDGHKLKILVLRPDDPGPGAAGRKNNVEYAFPDQFLMSEETCRDQVLSVLSEMHLPSDVHWEYEYLVRFLSAEAVRWSTSRNREGILYEINVKDNLDRSFEVEFCSGEEDACSSRISTTRMKETNCSICLKELSSEVSRVELSCFHLFHEDCLMTWLLKIPCCPLCRNNVFDQLAFYF